MKLSFLLTITATLFISYKSAANEPATADIMRHLVALAEPGHGIGPRIAATQGESKAADYIEQQWNDQGYGVVRQLFSYKYKNKTQHSQNLMVTLPGSSKKHVIIGAHYDSTGQGSMGAIDNAASVALILTLTELLADTPRYYTLTFIAFGAEEVSLQGSRAYVAALSPEQRLTIEGMINLDTIVGGDRLYIHSAHSTPYTCNTPDTYSSSPTLRNALLSLSNRLLNTERHLLHPAFEGYPEGETGGWSDHAAFACLGIPIAYFEATNFAINGKGGFDGYSQATHTTLWDCFDHDTMSACSRQEETKWGNIWHTQYDSLRAINNLFPGRLEKQLSNNLRVLLNYLTEQK